MVKSMVPHPLLTVLIVVVWMLLNGVSWGAAVLGLVLGITIPLLTSPYWPDRPIIRSPLTIVEYALIVLWDIVVANFQVAYLILFRRGGSLHSQYVTVPLDLTNTRSDHRPRRHHHHDTRHGQRRPQWRRACACWCTASKPTTPRPDRGQHQIAL